MLRINRSIVSELTFWLTLAVALTAAALASLYYASASLQMHYQLESEAEHLTDRLAAMLTLAAWNLDITQIQEISTAYLEAPNVVGVTVALQIDGHEQQVFHVVPEDSGTVFTCSQSIIRAGQELGNVEVQFSLADIAEMRQTTIKVTILTTLAAVAAIVLVTSLIMRRRLTLPLQQLSDGIRRIADGDYGAKLLPVPQQEINRIISSVNAMAVQISERKQSLEAEITRRSAAEQLLRQHKTHLEEEISQRTANLSQANIQLRQEVTDRHRAEQALRTAATTLQASNQDLEQFAYVISHDLQEPLRTITAFIQLLNKRYSEQFQGDAREYMDFVVGGAARMQRMISDLLAYSRVSRHGQELRQVDSDAVLERALANLQNAITESAAVIVRQPLPTVNADPAQLLQLFQNLIGNSIKFRRDQPLQVQIGAETNADHWRFWIRDNGIGISAEHRERIFLLFQRLHGPDKYSGSGIGLAICKRIVERHGGQIWAQPNADADGTTFWFTLAKHVQQGSVS